MRYPDRSRCSWDRKRYRGALERVENIGALEHSAVAWPLVGNRNWFRYRQPWALDHHANRTVLTVLARPRERLIVESVKIPVKRYVGGIQTAGEEVHDFLFPQVRK